MSSRSASKYDWASSDSSVYCSWKLNIPPYDASCHRPQDNASSAIMWLCVCAKSMFNMYNTLRYAVYSMYTRLSDCRQLRSSATIVPWTRKSRRQKFFCLGKIDLHVCQTVSSHLSCWAKKKPQTPAEDTVLPPVTAYCDIWIISTL